MIDYISQFNPITQALLATLFTWGVTSLGAAIVVFTKRVSPLLMVAGENPVGVVHSFNPAQVAKELLDDESTFFVVERDSKLIAYAKIRTTDAPECVGCSEATELERIYVEHRFLGTGVGQMLLDAAIEATRGNGHEVLWLGVWEHNPDAVAFYERFGFTTMGNKLFMMGADEQSDFIMRLRLSAKS